MLVKRLEGCMSFYAGDGTLLREVIHPKNDPIRLRYSVAHARVSPGNSSIQHRLNSSQVYYILKGKGRMTIGKESGQVEEGCAVYIPSMAAHKVVNTGKEDLEFLRIVDPAWSRDNEEIVWA